MKGLHRVEAGRLHRRETPETRPTSTETEKASASEPLMMLTSRQTWRSGVTPTRLDAVHDPQLALRFRDPPRRRETPPDRKENGWPSGREKRVDAREVVHDRRGR